MKKRRRSTYARKLRVIAIGLVGTVAILAANVFAAEPAAAETIRVGTVNTMTAAPLYIAQERGYFAAEGVPVELVLFEAGEPVAVAAAGGSIDFGITGLTAAFYSLAGEGALRIIAGGIREAPSFHFFGYFVSTSAYQGGLTSLPKLAGHSVALTQVGSPSHYTVALLAEKYGLNLKDLKLLPVQSIPNQISALAGGQADAAVLAMVPALSPLVQRGDIRVLGWVGDETPFQLSAVITATKTANQRADTVMRFLRAYRKGVRDYHDAFTGPGEIRQDGPMASEIAAIIAKHTGSKIEDMKLSIPYNDADARVDVKDVMHQIAWYRSEEMVKGNFEPMSIIDMRYVTALP